MQKWTFIVGIVTGIAGVIISGIGLVDQIVNADRRAAITGIYAGKAIVENGEVSLEDDKLFKKRKKRD